MGRANLFHGESDTTYEKMMYLCHNFLNPIIPKHSDMTLGSNLLATKRVLLTIALCLNIVIPLFGMAQDGGATNNTFEQTIHRLGLDEITNDFSEQGCVVTAEPSCAYLNITGTETMPAWKGNTKKVWVEVYLGGGVYFRKRAIIDAQGNSSLMFDKRNFKLTFCEDEWQGQETTAFAIGEWVTQDKFQFKAYYIDYLRGVGVVGYRLFNQMTASCGRPWTRALSHLTTIREKARCYPDGFPCVVYLGGEFYGIYAWQLRKSRENMNQTKDIAEHIHLDGTIGEASFWQGDIDWQSFEVRNPKGLYDVEGMEYDGDHPKELIDESSTAFDNPDDPKKVRQGKQRSAQVKHYVEAFSQVIPRLRAMEGDGAHEDAIRSTLEQHFDIQSLIDYACFHLAVNNWDGFEKNWQWFTYDGEKWFVTPYDLDCLMGNFFTGTMLYGSELFLFVPENGPFYFVIKFYQEEIRKRYCELRDLGVFSFDNMKRLLEDWYYRVGEDAYAEEWRRWPDSKCISETIINEGWKKSVWVNVGGLKDYDDTVTYHPGERCISGHIAWEALDTVCGVRPYAQLGYTDSLQRYEEFARQHLSLLDRKFGYVTSIEDLPISQFVNRKSVNSKWYDLSGRQIRHSSFDTRHLPRGIYIRDGKKVLVK